MASTSVSLAVIKDISTNYMTVLGMNQAYTSLKLRNKYDIVQLHGWFSIDTEKRYGYWKRFWKWPHFADFH